jgi:hypothetical protein
MNINHGLSRHWSVQTIKQYDYKVQHFTCQYKELKSNVDWQVNILLNDAVSMLYILQQACTNYSLLTNASCHDFWK